VGAWGIASLFILENSLLAFLFSLAGTAAALLVTAVVAGLVQLPSDGAIALFLDRGRLVLVPRVADIAATVGVVTVFSAIFAFFPARRGGRIPPVEALTRIF